MLHHNPLACQGSLTQLGSMISIASRYQSVQHHARRKCAAAFFIFCFLLGITSVQAQNSTSSLPIPLIATNNCPETIWPGVGTQHGVGPGTGGFELAPGQSNTMFVSWDWQGRLWGRTNCSFNSNGTGPSNLEGVNGAGAACTTGDCFGRVDCEVTGAVPATLAEFNLWGGVNSSQTFYDISLVDGYNIPLGIVYHPSSNLTWIPPNLVNCACIGTAGFLANPSRTGTTYTNSTYPIPYEKSQTNSGVGSWCPWNLQEYPPTKPGDGVYPYPDDNIQRPTFDPCLSACASSLSEEDCCTGQYNDPNVCPKSLYSQSAKAVCPDAYSYAFDDQTSTFIIPSGGGWEVVFCPEGRSTNILATFSDQLRALSQARKLTPEIVAAVTNITYIETHGNAASSARMPSSFAVVAVGLATVLWLTS